MGQDIASKTQPRFIHKRCAQAVLGQRRPMNKWKIGFWICLTTLLLTVGLGLYAILDQGVTLTYMKEGYADTKSDLDRLVKIINDTDLSKDEIKRTLKTDDLDFDTDTVSLSRTDLIFVDNKLEKIELTW